MALKKNQANNLLSEMLRDCRKYTIKRKFRRWITVYDIETVYEYLVTRKTNTKQTIDIMAMFKVNFDKYISHLNAKPIPFKALKILIKAAQKANVL